MQRYKKGGNHKKLFWEEWEEEALEVWRRDGVRMKKEPKGVTRMADNEKLEGGNLDGAWLAAPENGDRRSRPAGTANRELYIKTYKYKPKPLLDADTILTKMP